MTRKQLFEWVKEEYDTAPDYPWQDWNAVLRHKDSRKWYGLVMEIERSKLGLPGDGVVDALNVKCDPRIIGSLLGQPGYFRAYHMNKEQWITILLDDTVPENQIQELVRLSYEMTRQRRGKRDEFLVASSVWVAPRRKMLVGENSPSPKDHPGAAGWLRILAECLKKSK